MNKSTISALDELTKLAGFHEWKPTKHHCTGKWAGTIDHGVIFDNKLNFFISNGMKFFEDKVREYIQEYKTVMREKEKNKRILQIQMNKDNRIALSEKLYTTELLDIGVNTEDEYNFLWPYIRLKVNGREIHFVETGMSFAMKADNMMEWFTERKYPIYTAGGVEHPDFIFGNVRFSSTDELYKIRTQ